VYRYCLIRLAKAPEFFLPFLHAHILYVYSGLLKEKFISAILGAIFIMTPSLTQKTAVNGTTCDNFRQTVECMARSSKMVGITVDLQN